MRRNFAPTENYNRLLAAVAAAEERAAREAGLVLVTGPAGFGKSEAVKRFAVQQGAVYLRGKTHWSPRAMLAELVKALGGDPKHYREALFAQAVDLLSRETPRPIVVDEAEHACLDVKALESLRDISDTLENVVVLVGMDQLQSRIARHPQVYSRVAQVVEFQPASLEDVKALANALTEVVMESELLERIHSESQGRIRLVLNALGRAERIGLNNQAQKVSLADINGTPLVDEFVPRRQIRQ